MRKAISFRHGRSSARVYLAATGTAVDVQGFRSIDDEVFRRKNRAYLREESGERATALIGVRRCLDVTDFRLVGL